MLVCNKLNYKQFGLIDHRVPRCCLVVLVKRGMQSSLTVSMSFLEWTLTLWVSCVKKKKKSWFIDDAVSVITDVCFIVTGSDGSLCVTELEFVLLSVWSNTKKPISLTCRIIQRLRPLHCGKNKDKVLRCWT